MARKNLIKRNHTNIWLGCLIVCLVVLFVSSLCVGNYKSLGISNVFNVLIGNVEKGSIIENIVFMIRMPRTISAILIGGSLAVAGLVYQETFDNELASPDMLGVSTGACVGACIGILLGFSNINIQLLAFVSGILTVLLVFFLSIVFKRQNKISLVLSGILISGVLTSVMSLIKYVADPGSTLPTIIYWLMGSVANITYKQLLITFCFCLVSLIVLYLTRWRMNFFKIGESSAKSSGVNIKYLKFTSIVCATVLTSCCVSISGTIGWIGLVIPHLARIIFGNNTQKYLIPTFLFGSIFLLTIDIINRVISTAELPLGILCGIVGVFLFVLCFVMKVKKNEIED